MYLTETSAPTRGRPTKVYLDSVLLHKSPLVHCVWLYCDRLRYLVANCLL
jgi:hypothetical protein